MVHSDLMSSTELSPTSYLVLGLLTREGPSTPYDLKRHAAAALGSFWSFPHAVLYAEPPRLAKRGLATEKQERNGRRRRTFSITDKGVEALRKWLERPSRESPELRDPGLLQLFFADLGSSAAGAVIAHEQLAIHEAKLVGYQEETRLEGRLATSTEDARRAKKWRGQTLRMGVLYEHAAVDFWKGVAVNAGAAEAPRADDLQLHVAGDDLAEGNGGLV